MTVIQGSIAALALTGLTGGAVIQEVADYQDGQLTQPFVSISPYGPEKVGDELNDRDGVYYGILVGIIAKPGVTSLEQRLGWRQTLRRNFNNVSLRYLIDKFGLPANVNLGQNYNLKIEPGNAIEPKAFFDRNAFVSGFIVRAFFQEPRS